MKIYNPKLIIILASIFALATAFYAQHVMKLPPCEMCIWQRWAYVAVIFFALISVISTQVGILNKIPAFAGMTISLLLVLAISVFHFGVEQKWWEGFTTCSASFKSGTIEGFKAQIMAAPVVRCDAEVPFLFGLSMVAWSVLYSFVLNIYAIKSLFSGRRAR